MVIAKQQVALFGRKAINIITDYSKQTELIKVSDVTTPIHIIGAGALGSWIAFIFLKMGFKDVNVYDYDTIEEHNIPNQLFREDQIGSMKTAALDNIYMTFFEDDDIESRYIGHNAKVDADHAPMTGIIISAVDSMSARKEIFEAHFEYNTYASLWVEGRLSIYGAYVYAIEHDDTAITKYKETLYSDEESEVSACGVSQTALPAAINAASLMVMQVIEHLSSHRPIPSLQYSLPWLDVMKEDWK